MLLYGNAIIVFFVEKMCTVNIYKVKRHFSIIRLLLPEGNNSLTIEMGFHAFIPLDFNA